MAMRWSCSICDVERLVRFFMNSEPYELLVAEAEHTPRTQQLQQHINNIIAFTKHNVLRTLLMGSVWKRPRHIAKACCVWMACLTHNPRHPQQQHHMRIVSCCYMDKADDAGATWPAQDNMKRFAYRRAKSVFLFVLNAFKTIKPNISIVPILMIFVVFIDSSLISH